VNILAAARTCRRSESRSAAGALGERVIAHFRDLCRLEGVIVRRRPFWFTLDLMASPLRKQRIAERIE
jgi:hypothetical protein